MKKPILLVALILTIFVPVHLCIAEDSSTTKDAKTVRVLLVGDSTVTDHAGWGRGFKSLAGKSVECLNHAKGGASSKSYRDAGLWKKALKTKADYVLFQFGHNDQPGKGPSRETDPKTTYRQTMARYVDEARAAGMQPILVTSLTRRTFVDGKVKSSLTGYVEAVRELAKEKKVPLVELHQPSIDLANKVGPEGCLKMGPTLKDGRADRTHLNSYGSKIIAGIVIKELVKAVPELAPHFPTK